ncbi:MAG: WG repeat-containing protein [Muribaculaceae bacterium]|nr:WG repeat-containing protein [Muribaculaceae bacterium]
MNCHKRFATLAIAALSLLMLPQAEAQLFKKISKGLEKINKTIEKVDKTLNQSTTANTGSSVAADAGTASAGEVMVEEVTVESAQSGDEEVVRYATPYLTPETLFIEGTPYTVSNVSEGIFSLRRKGSSFFTESYEFWKVDGRKLFDAKWEKCTPALMEPAFSDGVVAMRKPTEGYKKGNACLLYADGRVKDLGPGIFAVTNFVDGAAIVWPDVSSTKSYYIDTTGKKIYPSILVDGGQPDCIRPLKDGLRAFPKAYNEWGFMDANGVVKLAAKYKSATDFSEGYAWVVMADNTKHLIDKTGKSVFQAPEYNSRTSDVVDGLFYVEKGSKTCYYNLKGEMVGMFEYGTGFHDGYAFVFSKQILSNTSCELIDKDMKVVRTLGWENIEGAIVDHTLVFNKSNMFAFPDFVMRYDGEGVLGSFRNYSTGSAIDQFKNVSDEGYILVSNIEGAGNMRGAAILKSTGEVVLVISEDPSFSGPLNNSALPFRGAPDASGQLRIKTVDIHQAPIGPKM